MNKAWQTIAQLLDVMRDNADTCIVCKTAEQRNEVTQILVNEYGVGFGTSGYAEKCYGGSLDDSFLHLFLSGHGGGIEYYLEPCGSGDASYEDFIQMYDDERCKSPICASDADLSVLFS